MTTVPLNEAKERLAELATLVGRGETVTITHDGKPLFDLVPPKAMPHALDFEALRAWKSAHGVDKIFGEIPDDFDEPLPEDFLITPLPE